MADPAGGGRAGERADFERALAGEPPDGFAPAMAAHKREMAAQAPAWATRKASHAALGAINAALPETLGGSADLTGSNNTRPPTSRF